MKKTLLLTIGAMIIGTIIPTELMAQTTTDFGGQEFMSQSDKIMSFLFGPALRVVGILGGAVGVINSIMSSSIKPLLIYGGIGLGVNLVPRFIDGIFNVSGMLLP